MNKRIIRIFLDTGLGRQYSINIRPCHISLFTMLQKYCGKQLDLQYNIEIYK
mgnify:CR=1 FL=1